MVGCLKKTDEVGKEGLLQSNEIHSENPYKESFIEILKKYQEDEELMALFLEFALKVNTRRN